MKVFLRKRYKLNPIIPKYVLISIEETRIIRPDLLIEIILIYYKNAKKMIEGEHLIRRAQIYEVDTMTKRELMKEVMEEVEEALDWARVFGIPLYFHIGATETERVDEVLKKVIDRLRGKGVYIVERVKDARGFWINRWQ